MNSKIGLNILLCFVALGLFVGLAAMRNAFVGNHTNIVAISMTSLLGINMAFYVALIIIKWLVFPSKKVIENNQLHNTFKEEIAKKEQAIQKKNTQIATSHTKEKSAIKKEVAEYEKLIQKQNDLLEEKYKELKKYQLAYNEKLSIGLHIHKELTALTLQAISTYTKEVHLFRNDGLVLELPKHIELQNPFKGNDFIGGHNINNLFSPN